MGFDPDKYLQKNAPAMANGGGFDPDAYLSKKTAAKKSETAEEAQTALEQYGNTVTGGYLPHLQALTEKPMTWVLNKLTGNDVKADGYVESRDKNISRQEEMAKQNPKSALLGQGAGIGASLLLPAGSAAKGATATSRIGNAAKVGAMYGAAMNPGDVEGELSPLQLVARGKNAAIGGALGLGGGILGEGLSSGAKYVSEKLGANAEEKAFKALGPYQRDTLKAAKRTGQVKEIGRELLDEGLLTGAPSWEKLGQRTAKAADAKGAQLENIVDDIAARADALDPASKAIALPGQSAAKTSGIDRAAVGKALRDELLSKHTDIPGAAARNAKVEKLISEFEAGGDRFIPVRDNEELKRAVGKMIKWDRLPNADIPLEEEVQRALYNKIKQGSEDAAAYLSNQLGDGTAEVFKKAKKSYGNLKTASDIAQKRAAKESANRFLSPSDYGTGALGAILGASTGDSLESKLKNGAIGFAAAGLNKFARTRGNSIAATALNKASQTASGASNALKLMDKSPLLRTLANIGSKRENIKMEQFDPQLLNMLAADPSLIDSFEDPKMRERLLEALKNVKRNPSSQ